MKESSTLSIGIPTFSRIEYLKEAVESALQQKTPPFEIIISDDGDTKAIAEYGMQMQQQHQLIRYIKTPHRLGLSGNWNYILSQARGEFLTIIGDDDFLRPDFVSEHSQVINSNSILHFSNHNLIDQEGNPLEKEALEWEIQYGREKLQSGWLNNAIEIAWKNSIPMSTSVFRVDVAQKYRFKETLNTPEMEMFIRIALDYPKNFYFSAKRLVDFRTHSQSATSSGLWSEKMVEELLAIDVEDRYLLLKQEAITPLMINAVGRLISNREWDKAKQFLFHSYYPHNQHSVRAFYRLCLMLPSSVGSRLYQMAKWIKNL